MVLITAIIAVIKTIYKLANCYFSLIYTIISQQIVTLFVTKKTQ